MWIISFLPNWVFHLLLTAGILGTIAGFVLGMIPLIQKYIFPIRIISILLLSFSLYIEGGLTNEESWQLKVKEVEAKLALQEVKSQAETVKIVEKVVTKTAYIKTKGQDIIKYLDKEVVKDNEVIRYVETCPAIPQVILKSVNEAATIPHQATK
tara:strand:+ start:702 stop:1163 length:462 start_codon:yes stop_codon:yes gene_type:complete